MLKQHVTNTRNATDRAYTEYRKALDTCMDAPIGHDEPTREKIRKLFDWVKACERAEIVAWKY